MTHTDEVEQAAQTLYDRGYRGNSNAYLGISPDDEQFLVSLILQTSSPAQLPSIHDVDQKDTIYCMIGRYIRHGSPELAQTLAEHLKHLFLDHFKPTVQQIMEDIHERSDTYRGESDEAQRNLERDCASFDKQRM